MNTNPITKMDYPDCDVIRVEDTYYLISTTMYYMPGGVILRSYDLIHWEIATYIFDKLDDSESERLVGYENNYGKGMWAASLRYHNGKFYVAFVSYNREDTHLYISDSIEGPWEHRHINDYFHDCSLLFDEDRLFIISGNTDIRLTELDPETFNVKQGGIDKIIIKDDPEAVTLGYEGAHFYKINGKYYITLIHWPKYTGRRTEAVFVSNTVDGEYTGKDVMWDDMGYRNAGVAQGGIVDTPFGDWYAVLFQDSGAVGRVPVLMPVSWENDFPVFGIDGSIPANIEVKSTRPDYEYEPLYSSSFAPFKSQELACNKYPFAKPWQFNHVPDNSLWSLQNEVYTIRSGKITTNPLFAQNTLTQRMMLPKCGASVTVDATGLNNGDTAGLIALQGCYCMLGIRKENDEYYMVKIVRSHNDNPYSIGCKDFDEGELVYKEKITGTKVIIRMEADFTDEKDEVVASYKVSGNEGYVCAGDAHKMYFYLDHFTGARFGLCMFSQEKMGGEASFYDFKYMTTDM